MFANETFTLTPIFMHSKIVRTLVLSFAEITLDELGIIRVNYLSGSVIDVAEKKELFKAYQEITNDVKSLFIFKAQNNVNFTKEAKKYSIRIEPFQPFMAIAVIADNLAYQILADFYFKIYKPKVAYKVVKSDEKAIEWLLSYQKNFHDGKIEKPKSSKFPFFNF
ncbi:MAG: hypothetical protein K0S44_1310 [Bacteroidetes bacterium]|jgi:hypothetical protein|nr:hypothetical protein [Bacteroidota bacterium]